MTNHSLSSDGRAAMSPRLRLWITRSTAQLSPSDQPRVIVDQFTFAPFNDTRVQLSESRGYINGCLADSQERSRLGRFVRGRSARLPK
jgi:hypothetical protein